MSHPKYDAAKHVARSIIGFATSRRRIILVACSAVLGALFLHFMINGFLVARKIAALRTDERNLKRIGLAISNYYNTYKRWPSPTTQDGSQPATAWSAGFALLGYR